MLVPNEPLASIVKEGLEGFATGRFRTQAEVARFFTSFPEFPKDRGGAVSITNAWRILTNSLYTGHVVKPDWNISLQPGRHPALITLAQFEAIERRLKEESYVPARPDISHDFPLRGAVACACCARPLTACWSTSKTGKKHAYYQCFTKGCARSRKSIRKERIEGDFERLLESLTPSANLFQLTRAMLEDAWNQRAAQAKALREACTRDLEKVDRSIAALLDRLVQTTSDVVIATYEKRIAELERQKLIAKERRDNVGTSRHAFGEMFELAFGFLANPSNVWRSDQFAHKQMVLRLAFAGHLPYCAEKGFSNPKLSLPFNILDGIKQGVRQMAEGVGFEPTIRFPVYTLSKRAPSATRPSLRERLVAAGAL